MPATHALHGVLYSLITLNAQVHTREITELTHLCDFAVWHKAYWSSSYLFTPKAAPWHHTALT